VTRQQTFGQFVRARRNTLGLGLRQFCRANGLSPSNLSRVETGKLRPPERPALLESYAKALGLAEGSNEWARFFDLAAAETGRLPSELMAGGTVARRLPRVLDELRGVASLQPSSRVGTSWVCGVDLNTWADSLDCQGRLPQLVRRLAHATLDRGDRVDFPAGEGVQRRGWDGIVEAARGNSIVPKGVSLWELSAAKGPGRAAEDNLRKRSHKPLGFDRREAVFVFVTPRKWEGKRDWQRAKGAEGAWADVRAYDADDLEQWLEQAPAVGVWMATLFGRRPAGMMDLEDHWENLAASLQRPLPPEVFLTSREAAVETLNKWLDGPPDCLAFETPSPEEALDFLAAHTRALGEVRADAIAARVVVVYDAESWRSLCLSPLPLVLVAAPQLPVGSEFVAEGVRRGHHVLLCSNRLAGPQTTHVVLPRPYRYDLEKALEAAGFPDQSAERHAREARGSLTVLKRKLARFPGTDRPAWSDRRDLVPILLAGAWDDSCEPDTSALADLARRSYHEVLRTAEEWRAAQDPPVMRALTHWDLVSREDSWLHLRHLVTSADLDAFDRVAFDVLAEPDPQWQLPAGERWLAGIHSKTPAHSPQLRRGVAETVALLGAMPDELAPHPRDPQTRATLLVRRLLGESPGWERWAALSPVLPLLAEAAPDEFLDAAGTHKDQVLRLFEEEGSSFLGHSPHTGLLWALETLAWHPNHLPAVALTLAFLTEHDPARDDSQGRLANRPGRSLRHILLPWIRQTAASVDERLCVMDLLLRQFPDVGYELLLGLLPATHDHCFPVARPAWRDWALTVPERVPSREYWDQVMGCCERLVAHVGRDAVRWVALLKRVDHLPRPHFDQVLTKLGALRADPIEEEARHAVHEVLRDTVTRHQKFSSAKWALPPEAVGRLDEVRAAFEPEDPVRRHEWLFTFHPEGPGIPQDGSWDERVAAADALRLAALRELFERGGLAQVLESGRRASRPDVAGSLLGLHGVVQDWAGLLPDLLVSGDRAARAFAGGYVAGCFGRGGWEWVNGVPVGQWSPSDAGAFAVHLPCSRETWDFVESLGAGVCDHYWRQTPGVNPKATAEDVSFGVRMLLQHGRPRTAIEALAYSLQDRPDADFSLIAGVLQTASRTHPTEHDSPDGGMLHFHIGQLFERLQADPSFDQGTLARLEWAYLPVLEQNGQLKALQSYLAEDPEFFAQVLGRVYRSHNAPQEDVAEPTQEEQLLAGNAFTLLRSWKQIPGREAHGASIDGAVLEAWVDRARELCAASGRLAVCDITIGELLAHSPHDPDGTWPCLPVREVIERIEGDELGRGLHCGIMNSRGVTTRSLTEGGAQERELAAGYRQYAEACRASHPRTAAVLRSVADGYERDARREDESVEDRW
jgi:transcriptional regulator with XRE-family HTH domain